MECMVCNEGTLHNSDRYIPLTLTGNHVISVLIQSHTCDSCGIDVTLSADAKQNAERVKEARKNLSP